jgi:hypothetical protein
VTADLRIAENYGEVPRANPARRLFRVATSLFNLLFLDGTPQDELGK